MARAVLNATVSYDVLVQLEKIAHEQGVTRSKAVEQLLRTALCSEKKWRTGTPGENKAPAR